MKSIPIALALVAIMTCTPAWAQDDAAKGKKVFQKCRACHAVEPGKNKIGPTLHGVFGRKAGSVEGFNYSKAMKQSEIVWNEETLDKYLADPNGYIPGNRMTFDGLRQEIGRASCRERGCQDR